MASYEKRGKLWTVRFRALKNDKPSFLRLSGFKTKKEAETAYEMEMLKQRKNKQNNNIKFWQLYEVYKEFKKSKVKESSYLTIEHTLKNYVLPYFKDFKINEITKQHIVNWQIDIENNSDIFRPNAKIKNPLSFGTKSKLFSFFVNLMNFAVDYCGLYSNPVSKVGNFKNNEQKKEMQFWTNLEFEQFISVTNDLIYKTFFALLYLTGARKGEAMALTWTDINLNNSFINISKTYTRRCENGGYKITSAKTKSSIRQVIIPDVLINLLRTLKNYYSKQEGFNENCFVFGLSKPLSTTEIDRKKALYCKLANVKNIRCHDFRHSHASLLLNSEQNILLVAQRLGHTDISMTLNTYSHLFPNKQKELMNSLNINI